MERLQLYKISKKKVVEHNKKFAVGESSYDLEINQFADLKPKEKRRNLG